MNPKAILIELQMLWRRPGTWILLGIWLVMAMMFGYVIPYVDRDEAFRGNGVADLLPANLTANTLAGFPFFGGVLILILAVMTFGGDYGWNVVKTLLTQRAGRIEVFGSKLVALLIGVAPFVVLDFLLGIGASQLVARAQDASTTLDSIGDMLVGMAAAAWLILAVWAALGALLATLTRGTSLAIGLGILYGLVFEGLLAALLDSVDFASPLIKGFLRTNAYSLVQSLGNIREIASDNGPGSFTGPYVGGGQALAMLLAYLIILTAASALLFRHRDVA
jgi:ABC-2 type transport system permease protein